MARSAQLLGFLVAYACTPGQAIRGETNLFTLEHDAEVAGSCTRMCSTMDFFTVQSFDGDVEAIKRKADEKCARKDCMGCVRKGAGLSTMPDCVPKPAPVVPEPEPEPVLVPEPVLDPAPPAEDSPALEGEVCKLAATAWCLAPSRNPGAKYRQNGKPLCCSKVEDSRMADAPAAVEELIKANEAKDIFISFFAEAPATPATPAPPMPEPEPEPVCGDGPFAVEDSLCVDTATKLFANKVCCDQYALQLLQEKDAAAAACHEVEDKHCKPDAGTFEKKRGHYAAVPKAYTCVRRYMCYEGQGNGPSFGPVSKLNMCMKESTKLSKNLPGHTACVAVKK